MRGIRLHSGCLHNYHHQRKSCGTIYSVPCSPPRSPPPSPVSRAQLNKELSSMTSINDTTCIDCTESPKKCPYFFHRLDHELQRLTTLSNMTSVMQIPVPSTCRRCSVGRFSVPISPTGSIPMSLHKASSLSRWFDSVPHSRGESTLELEAIAAVHQLSFAVQSISVSEMLPRTPDLIFINITTLEGQPYCLELTNKGWRITSLRSDCMQGDFTRMELFTKYYDSIYDLMEVISPNYKQRFTEKLEQRLRLLETEGDELVAPSSSYMTSPCFSNYSPKQTSSSSNSSTEDESSLDPAI